MKQLLSILFYLLAYSATYAEGINFEKGTWKEALNKAKAEKKIIYLDVYASWCGPCKMMAKNYFPDKIVADVYNKDFINVSIDAEKGEGIEIAKQYNVSGYPTNLFIDAATSEVIYKVVGAPRDKFGFINYAITAIAEKNDLMRFEDYERTFEANKYDESFLVKCIEKYKRLDKNNDKLLDAYVDKYSSKQSLDSNVHYLLGIVSSTNNKGYDYVLKNYNKMPYPQPMQNYAERITFESIEYAARQKNNAYFDQSMQKYQQQFPDNKQDILSFKRQYYGSINDEDKLWNVNEQYAEMLYKKSAETFKNENAKLLAEAKEGLIEQIKQKKLNDKESKDALNNTLQANPTLSHQASSMASNLLNEIAWSVFEKKRNDKPVLAKALRWAQKASELCTEDDIASQLAVKDTYANLLFVNGKREEAIALESELVETAKKEKIESASSFEETLQKMKDGKL